MSDLKIQNQGSLDNWKQMPAETKRQLRQEYFLNGDSIDFVNAEAKKAYRIRALRLIDTLNVREPDRVPVSVPLGNLPFSMFGINMRTAMYDSIQAIEACRQFNEKYAEELEWFASPQAFPGKVMEILDYRQYSWPGHGLPVNSPGMQYVEGEYMTAEEYDDLLLDPSDFWFRIYLPRVFNALAPFSALKPFTDIVENVSVNQFGAFGTANAGKALASLNEAGRELHRIDETLRKYGQSGPAQGFPGSLAMAGVLGKAPFDTLGDTLRGTSNIMKDMYRRPDKVLAACEKIADLQIRSIRQSALSLRTLVVSFPLHKGADGWMSQKQFETFYWPTLKKVMLACIQEGLVPIMFAEGSYNTRLESINEFAKGAVAWRFDRTEMPRAKKILGDRCCIEGNVPSSLLITGSAADVKAYCRNLIETCGQGGGYQLSAGAIVDNPKLENLRAMVAAGREYGVYIKQ
jgi:hypothetical protein